MYINYLKEKYEWDQDTPSMQLRVIIGDIQMNMSNLEDGITPQDIICERVKKLLQQASLLSCFLNKGSWEDCKQAV